MPSAYLVSSRVAASSTASEMARPSDPVESGFSSSAFRPAFVSIDGEPTTVLPQVSIIARRYGFVS